MPRSHITRGAKFSLTTSTVHPQVAQPHEIRTCTAQQLPVYLNVMLPELWRRTAQTPRRALIAISAPGIRRVP